MAKKKHSTGIFYNEHDDAWLGLGNTEEIVKHPAFFNPLARRTDEERKLPGLHELRVMHNPEYLSLAAKVFLNVNLLPEQALILYELWTRPFPMFVASRGFGKAILPTEKVRVKEGWEEIQNLQSGDRVYGSDGRLTNVLSVNRDQDLEFYKVTLRDGRTIECCENHMWKVWDKNKNRNKNEPVYSNVTTKELLEQYYWVRKDSKAARHNKLTKEYRYALPINRCLQEESNKDYLVHPYVVGVLLGDGCITRHDITISSEDTEIIDRVRSLLPPGYKIELQPSSPNDYSVTKTSKDVPAFWTLLDRIGILGHDSHTKFIPKEYKFGNSEQRMELIRGLMDTDGYSNGQSVIEYYTVSNKLSDDFLDVARSLGLHCRHSTKESWLAGVQYADCNRISIYTKEAVFSLPRKLGYLDHPISKQGQSKYEKVFITNIEYVGKKDGCCITVDNEDNTYLTKDYIVTHNSWLLAVYAMLKILLTPPMEDGGAGCKVVIVGAAFRQSKVIFEYMETIWRNAPIYRSVCDTTSGPRRDVDRCTMRVNENWAIAVPLGDGSKIRGLRATIILADEFASIPPEIYETVVAGFASVKSDPLGGVQAYYRRESLKKKGMWDSREEHVYQQRTGNQAILSGTADYSFKHFAEYHRRYCAYIRTEGNTDKLMKVLGDAFDEEQVENMNPEDYSVIRIPYELIPKGFMDERIVLRAKATVHTGIYQMEYGAIFTDDSDGFFKRSLIESCVATDKNVGDIHWPLWCPQSFDTLTRGHLKKQYVIGVDPASEADNFSIVVMEVCAGHARIVYVWTTNRKDFTKRKKLGLTNVSDFYGFCARKIRDLAKVFPLATDHPMGASIGLDAQGGGIAVMEALHDPDKYNRETEKPFWPIIDPDKEGIHDLEPGLHCLEMVQFADGKWTSEANHGLRKDFEDKVTLFPRFDTATLELALADDKFRSQAFEEKHGKKLHLYDTLEDAVMETEELKDELTTIVMTRTGTGVGGRDRWDTPEIKMENGKKGRLRKDRYSSLVIANMIARKISRAPTPIEYDVIGGFVSDMPASTDMGELYRGPEWFTKGAGAGFVGQVIERGV